MVPHFIQATLPGRLSGNINNISTIYFQVFLHRPPQFVAFRADVAKADEACTEALNVRSDAYDEEKNRLEGKLATLLRELRGAPDLDALDVSMQRSHQMVGADSLIEQSTLGAFFHCALKTRPFHISLFTLTFSAPACMPRMYLVCLNYFSALLALNSRSFSLLVVFPLRVPCLRVNAAQTTACSIATRWRSRRRTNPVCVARSGITSC